MLKTILKTLALSAATLTFLSACGASDALNAAIRAYELNQQAASKKSGSKSSGYLGEEEDDGKYYPAVLAQTDERFLPSLSGESANRIEPIKQRLVADDGGLAEIEEQHIAEESRPIENTEKQPIEIAAFARTTEEQPIADGAESAPYISTAVHPGTNTYIMDPPLEEQTTAEEVPPIKKQPISRAEKRRLAILAEKQRIQDELKADPSAFNTTSARVASIRVTGTHKGGDNYDITRSKTQDTFGISRDEGEDPVLTMTVNGVGHKVAPYLRDLGFSGGKVTIYYNENGVGPYFTGSADIKKIIRGTHATIQGDYVGYATDMTDYGVSQSVDYTRGYATIGIQTPAPVVVAQTAVATYNGTGSLLADLNSGDYNFWRLLRVSITMSVDFDANTIAGTGRERHSQNKITFNSAPIVGNGFEGTFAMNSHARNNFNLNGNPTGQYSGNFFGANADDLAGVMSFQGASKDLGVDIIGSGGFRADRQ